MLEKILEIGRLDVKDDGEYRWDDSSGFQIVTTLQKIAIEVSEGQQCCEEFGYFWSNDNFADYIGATLRAITVTDGDRNTIDLDLRVPQYLDEGKIMFVTFETDRGRLQFTAYNAHNGYYAHKATVKSEQITVEKWL